MKIAKKYIGICMSLLLAMQCCPAGSFALEGDADSNSVITGSYSFTSNERSDKQLEDDFEYRDDCFTHSSFVDNSYLLALSTQAAISSASYYGENEIDRYEGNSSNCGRNVVALLKDMGFEDVETNTYYTVEKLENSAGAAIGHRSIRANGQDYTLLAVIPRSAGYKQEWTGNFTVGVGNVHEGFKAGRDEILRFAKNYIDAHGITGSIKLWIAGHSRGAAISNLLGGFFAGGGIEYFGGKVSITPEDIYCYTFATPKTIKYNAPKNEVLSVAGKREDVNYNAYSRYDSQGDPWEYTQGGTLEVSGTEYRGIRNYPFPYDFITYLPPESMGYTYYGRVEPTMDNSGAVSVERMLEELEKVSPYAWKRFTETGDYRKFQQMNVDLPNLKLKPVGDITGQAGMTAAIEERIDAFLRGVGKNNKEYVESDAEATLQALAGIYGQMLNQFPDELSDNAKAFIKPLVLIYLDYAAKRMPERTEADTCAFVLAELLGNLTGKPINDYKSMTVDELVVYVTTYLADHKDSPLVKTILESSSDGDEELGEFILDIIEACVHGVEEDPSTKTQELEPEKVRSVLYNIIPLLAGEDAPKISETIGSDGSGLYTDLVAALLPMIIGENVSLAEAADRELASAIDKLYNAVQQSIADKQLYEEDFRNALKAHIDTLISKVSRLRELLSCLLFYTGGTFSVEDNIKVLSTLAGNIGCIPVAHYNEVFVAWGKACKNTSQGDSPEEGSRAPYVQRSWADGKLTEETQTAEGCRPLDGNQDKRLSDGWYVTGNGTFFDELHIDGTVNIILSDNTTLNCYGGIIVHEGGTLNLYGQSDGSNMGVLNAVNNGAKYNNIFAGICVDSLPSMNNAATLNIYGGKIYAKGSNDAASAMSYDIGGSGIGGTGGGVGDGRDGGNINIYGGSITAIGASGAAGIGGGSNGGGGSINIYGGTTDARAGTGDNTDGIITRCGGAGIGGGYNGSGGNIAILGGTVKAEGSPKGAGIGGGDEGGAGTINISGGDVDALGGTDAAGIGGGSGSEGGTVTIEGGSVKASSRSNGAGIGGGNNSAVDSIDIKGGKIQAGGGESGAGIGGGNGMSGGSVNISSGSIDVRGGRDGAGIGGGKGGSGGTINISGGTITTVGGADNGFKYSAAEYETAVTCGAGIGGGKGGSGGTINISGNADILLAKGGDGSAGIGGGEGGNGGNITISGGTAYADSRYQGAGIGGGRGADGGNITITDGYVKALCGGGAAGIGGGLGQGSGKIRITGGTVDSNAFAGGAGIGTGSGCDVKDKATVDISIEGGSITAKGGGDHTFSGINHSYSAGVGIGTGGKYEILGDNKTAASNFSGTILFNGGTVNVNGIGAAGDAAMEGFSSTVEFKGGTVQVNSSPIRANTVNFADNMRMKGVEASQREEKYKSGGSFTIDVCDNHDERTYSELSDLEHFWQCRYCGTTGNDSHTYGEPEWIQTDEGEIARFTCDKCGHAVEGKAENAGGKMPEAEQSGAELQGTRQSSMELMSVQQSSVKPLKEKTEDVALLADNKAGDSVTTVEFEDRTYTYDPKKTSYTITAEECENGRIEAAKEAEVGKTVLLTVTPDEHYHIKSVSVNGVPLTAVNGSYSFTMPRGNVKVRAEFEADTVKWIWVNRCHEYEYDDEWNIISDELVDTVVYTEEVPYGTEYVLPKGDEFAYLLDECHLDAWEVTKGNKTVEQQPGYTLVADADTTITATWKEHDVIFSTSEDGETITASCSDEACCLAGYRIAVQIVKPLLSVYGQTGTGYSANATLALPGLDASMYGAELEAVEGYIQYYPAEKNAGGEYVKTGGALDGAPAKAGDYVAELAVEEVKTAESDSDTVTASVGYTIAKADPAYEVPNGLTAKPGCKLGEIEFSQPDNGRWTWLNPELTVDSQGNYMAVAVFTPEDRDNYNILSDIVVTVNDRGKKTTSGGGGGGGGTAITPTNPANPTKPSDPVNPTEPTKPTDSNESVTGFTDVPEDAYYADAVDWAVKNGITTGKTESLFAPEESCTRAQMVTFLWRAAGSPEPAITENPFTDTDPNAYYSKAVLWAVEKGITKGVTETTFDPDGTVNRGQTVTFIYRDSLRSSHEEFSAEQSSGTTPLRAAGGQPVDIEISFTDLDPDQYYIDAVKWAVANNITKGTGAGTFGPEEVCTRSQIVTLLYRYYAA